MTKTNLVLIGMPGAGKSTVGILLAKSMALDFVDTDVLIQRIEGRTLQDIIDLDGYLALRRIENDVLLGLHVTKHVIATGGSAVYSDQAMKHLGRHGIIIYLELGLEEIRSRISNENTRGIAKRPNQSFEDVYEERRHLYERYADITIHCSGLTQDQVCEKIAAALKEKKI